MKKMFEYRFIVGAVSIAAGILSLACLAVGVLAVNGHFEAFSDPTLTLMYATQTTLVKWFNLLDMLGYYLLLLPLLLFFHQHYRYRTPWISLITFSGLAYVLIGAIGAAILTAVWPVLIADSVLADPQNKMIIEHVFKSITIMVTNGLWNILEVLFAAVWWLGLGTLLLSESKWIGWLTLIAGISTLMDALGNMFNIYIMSELGLNMYLLLGILWPIIIGVWIIRKYIKKPSASIPQFNTSYDHA